MTGAANWVPMGDIADGYAVNQMEATDALSGREFSLHFQDGSVVTYAFDDESTVSWQVSGGADDGVDGSAEYKATMPRENVFFVDYMVPDEPRTSVTLILDLGDRVATRVRASVPGSKAEMPTLLLEHAMAGEPLSAGNAAFSSASIGRPFEPSHDHHEPTDELTGKRVKYTYSDDSVYEHIYLNDSRFVWHCLKGEEKDLAEASPCTYYKIADSLYLIVWEEIVLPVVGIVLIDLRALKTTGKMLCDDKNDFESVVNIPMGAYAEPLNETPTV